MLEGLSIITKEKIQNMDSENLEACFSAVPIPEKPAVMSYFRSIGYIGISSGHFTDIITDKDSGHDNKLYIDDKFFWYENEIYYFDKYNLCLNPEFVKHACEKVKS